MEKKRKSTYRRLFGLTIGEFSIVATLVAAAGSFIISGVLYFDRKFESIDRRFEAMDHKFETRFDAVDERLERIEGDLTKTSDLLNVYLTWRFLYVSDPTRKHLTPRYDPSVRKLEFVDKNNRVVK